jgi:hypothetical protein
MLVPGNPNKIIVGQQENAVFNPAYIAAFFYSGPGLGHPASGVYLAFSDATATDRITIDSLADFLSFVDPAGQIFVQFQAINVVVPETSPLFRYKFGGELVCINPDLVTYVRGPSFADNEQDPDTTIFLSGGFEVWVSPNEMSYETVLQGLGYKMNTQRTTNGGRGTKSLATRNSKRARRR